MRGGSAEKVSAHSDSLQPHALGVACVHEPDAREERGGGGSQRRDDQGGGDRQGDRHADSQARRADLPAPSAEVGSADP